MPDFFGAIHPALTPLLIFTARLLDVTLSTVRILFIARGLRQLAPLVGFVEILIWLVAISQVLAHLDRPINYIAYAAGFAAGTWTGLAVEGRLALGLATVRIITQEDASELIDRLKDERFGVTSFAARGAVGGRVRLILSVVRRRDLGRLQQLVEESHPKAFVTVSDVRAVSEGYLGAGGSAGLPGWLRRGK